VRYAHEAHVVALLPAECAAVPLCRCARPARASDAILLSFYTFNLQQKHVGQRKGRTATITCGGHGVRGLAKSGVEVASAPKASKDGKFEVVYPVGIPDEGVFDWLDQFLEKNPQYTELSSRSLMAWAKYSGVRYSGVPQSKDRPELQTGLSERNNLSLSTKFGQKSTLENTHSFKDKYINLARAKNQTYFETGRTFEGRHLAKFRG